MTTVVFVATYLGAAHGGINVFNAEILMALRAYDDLHTICVVPSGECVDDALASSTRVIALKSSGQDFGEPAEDAATAAELLREVGPIDAVVGHDVLTGPLAVEIGNRLGAKKVLIHHMAYGRYLSLMRDAEQAAAKEREQQSLFPQADYCFAVGPLLLDSLQDIRRVRADMPEPALLLPPLLDVTPVATVRKAPRILYLGRIERGNSVVKQGPLAASAIGHALGRAEGELADASVDMYGFDTESPLIHDFRRMLETEAGYRVPVRCLPFTTSRREMLDAIRDASLVVMPSVHEGFGLVAWEAMCCGIPLVVSTNSGFYRLVDSLGLAAYVDAVQVTERMDEDARSQQVQKLGDQIWRRISHPMEAHERAEKLLKGVRDRDVVRPTMDSLLVALGYSLNVTGSDSNQVSHLRGHGCSIEVDLTVQVDIGINESGRLHYQCLSSVRHVESAVYGLRNGLNGAKVEVTSSYLDGLRAKASSHSEADERTRASVKYEVDRNRIARLSKFFNAALVSLSSDEFVGLHFPDDCRALAFVQLIERFSVDAPTEDKTNIAAVRLDPYMTFSLWVSTKALEESDFYDPLFTIYDGATLADLWFECSSEIAAGYLRKCMADSIEADAPPPSLGSPFEWRIGSH